MELPGDAVMEILHRLPSKSLLRFKCVSKSWERYICDPSTTNSCRSRRWKPNPHMIGFFYQHKNAPSRFLFSPKDHAQQNFDKSVKFLRRRSLYLVASANGFLLYSREEINHRHYYVYNPATSQYLALPATDMCVKNVAVGFNCEVDNPIKDVISFTIVRYKIPASKIRRLQSDVTIEIFSSQTNVWTKKICALAKPLYFYLSCDNMKWLRSAGGIDGVFYWFDCRYQITVCDSAKMCFWSLDSPLYNGFWHERLVGVSDGILCYALVDYDSNHLTVWHLKSKKRARTAEWDIKYTGLDLVKAVNTCTDTSGLPHHGCLVNNMEFHPAKTNIIYLNIYNGFMICYNMDNSSVELVCDFGKRRNLNFFPYEWQEWPRLL